MTIIEQRIRAFLDLRQPWRHLDDNAKKEAAIEQIVAIVAKRAPSGDVGAWIGEVCERAMIGQKGNGWPSPDVWAASAGAPSAQAQQRDRSEPTAFDRALASFVQRISDGEGVDEHSLFGKLADAALERGLISFARLRQYQRGAFNARRAIYGADSAFAWAKEKSASLHYDMMEAHQAAERELRPQHAADGDLDERGHADD